jgi:hypothetical protein
MAKRKSLGGLAALLVLSVAAIGIVILLVSLLDSGDVTIPVSRIEDDPTPLIRIEDKDITRFHVKVGQAYEKLRAGKEGFALPEHGILLRYIELLAWEGILRRHNAGLTPQAIDEERARQIRESRDRAKMREIQDLLDPYPGMFEMLMVRTALANKAIYQLHGQRSIQKEAYEKAEAGLKEALRNPDFIRKIKEEDPQAYRRVDSRDPLAGMGPQGQPGPAHMPEQEKQRAAEHVRQFAAKHLAGTRPGDVCPNLVDEEGSYLVLRLLERSDDHVVYEVIAFRKIVYDVWFLEELRKLKGEVPDPATRELLKANLPADHKYRRWLLGE